MLFRSVAVRAPTRKPEQAAEDGQHDDAERNLLAQVERGSELFDLFEKGHRVSTALDLQAHDLLIGLDDLIANFRKQLKCRFRLLNVQRYLVQINVGTIEKLADRGL